MTSSEFYNNSVFWIENDKIHPNPYQPRREFDEAKLKDLAESIRMYGILQPLIVTRVEKAKDDGGLAVEYELISGERRLRASKIAGLSQVPALIRDGNDDDKVKLELAIIENLQREKI
jgi:ParB family chromosome partitioning protein